MSSKVYFYSRRTEDRENSLVRKLERLFTRAGFEELVEEDDRDRSSAQSRREDRPGQQGL